MKLPFIIFLLILVSIIFINWRQISKEKEEIKGKPGEEDEEEKKRRIRITEIIKISAAGAIFLVLLYALVPEFIVKNHKEIIILVVAMVAGAMLLGIKQDWEKSSTRKILRLHYIALTIIIILAVFYSDPEVRSWLEDFRQELAIQPQAAAIIECLDYQNIAAKGKNEIIARPNCWSGNISIPAQHWFRIVPEGRITIRTWSGRVIHDAPGQANWLGDEIPDANFRIISDESQPVKVAIISRPK